MTIATLPSRECAVSAMFVRARCAERERGRGRIEALKRDCVEDSAPRESRRAGAIAPKHSGRRRVDANSASTTHLTEKQVVLRSEREKLQGTSG